MREEGLKIRKEGEANDIGKELVALNDNKYTGNQLWFDPEDGLLKVVKKSDAKPSADAQVLDQIAEDGFMGIA